MIYDTASPVQSDDILYKVVAPEMGVDAHQANSGEK